MNQSEIVEPPTRTQAGMQALLLKPITPLALIDVLNWLNVPCKKNLNENIFKAKHGWHDSYRKNIEKKSKVEEKPLIHWWYTVTVPDEEIDMSSMTRSPSDSPLTSPR
ncbi:hypothetical protein DIPPA_32292 [Diplonema papillatum]|nr:hypothetical protein DIPPA_32292 [Diplonema papillatum]